MQSQGAAHHTKNSGVDPMSVRTRSVLHSPPLEHLAGLQALLALVMFSRQSPPRHHHHCHHSWSHAQLDRWRFTGGCRRGEGRGGCRGPQLLLPENGGLSSIVVIINAAASRHCRRPTIPTSNQPTANQTTAQPTSSAAQAAAVANPRR